METVDTRVSQGQGTEWWSVEGPDDSRVLTTMFHNIIDLLPTRQIQKGHVI